MTYTFANKEDLEVLLAALDMYRRTKLRAFRVGTSGKPEKQLDEASRCEMMYADLLDLTSK